MQQATTTTLINSSPIPSGVVLHSNEEEPQQHQWVLVSPNSKNPASCWKYFKKFHKTQEHLTGKDMAACLMCLEREKEIAKKENRAEIVQNFAVYYPDNSTSKLTRHLKSKHRNEFDKSVQEGADERYLLDNDEGQQQKLISDFLK